MIVSRTIATVERGLSRFSRRRRRRVAASAFFAAKMGLSPLAWEEWDRPVFRPALVGRPAVDRSWKSS